MEQKFIRIVPQAQIAASGKVELDLDTLRAQWGNDFNTLQITNIDAVSAINIYLDGQKIAYLTANNGVFSFDYELGIKFNFLAIENTNAGAVIIAENVKVFVGRTGKE